MNDIKILIACEESQRISIQFRERGFEAYSCDIQECSGGHPEFHIMQDVLSLLNGDCEFTTMDGIKHKIEGKWDLIIAHPTCFVAGTMIMTYDGIKPIEEIKEGDLVLTHKGRYRKVIQTMKRTTNSICRFYVENSGYIECTPNHPFYTKQMKRIYDRHNKAYKRVLDDFEWKSPKDFITERKPCGDIKSQTYLASVTDDIKEVPEYLGTEIGLNKFKSKKVCTLKMSDINFWYFVGRWLGDGWHCHKDKGRTHGYYGVGICCAHEQKEELEEKIKAAGFNYYGNDKSTTYRFEIDNKELSNFMRQFGEYSYGKKIPGFVTRLTDELGKALIQGYLDSDGYLSSQNTYSYGTVSKELAYGMKYMINKYYKVGVSIKKTDNSGSCVIEGRQCNVRPIYVSTFRLDERKQTRYMKDDKYIYTAYKNYEEVNKEVEVYNLSVEEDESYIANGIVAHNCTDLSVSGALRFEQKRKDGRQRESIEFFCKMLTADCEHICVENPINIISGDYIKKWFPDLCEKYGLPVKYSQIIQPYEYGDPESKRTCLWLKGLPLLQPTNILPLPECGHWANQTKDGQNKLIIDGKWIGYNDPRTKKYRAKTYPGIAKAIAEQYGDYLLSLEGGTNESE